ncbi:serine hydrolase domain-containing protein [Spongiimicrobium salis]|uniref:serine hydrolase domain-containing protein n=1 Tax=Spongiimicrobium salis TaxID=1667022 RepID=UPI00374DE9A7
MKIVKRLLLVLVAGLIFALVYNYPKLTIISGYASKNMASSVFIAQRTAESITKNDNNVPLIKLADTDVDLSLRYASSSVFGLMERKAVYREGLGCVLVTDTGNPAAVSLIPQRSVLDSPLPFPYGNNGTKDSTFAEVDYDQLKSAMDHAFADPEVTKTRTVLVVYKDHIIAEQYTGGLTVNTPILGWSMTKSITGTLYGILQHQGKINVNDLAPVSEWQGDDRKNISLNHLLRMQSGLEWDEDYASISDVNKMLFLADDMTQPQILKEALAPPTEIWNYSSGTSNLLSGILRQEFNSHQEYLDFPYTQLIDKIGMHSMLIETDLQGNFVGSSYAWATTRDWAKFGLLYLHEGNWNGEQLFARSWDDYVRKPTAGSEGTYGAHFWLNAEGKYPDVPRDMYSANGFQGQRVFIIPSKDLVVVRTGLGAAPNFDINTFLKEIIAAIP